MSIKRARTVTCEAKTDCSSQKLRLSRPRQRNASKRPFAVRTGEPGAVSGARFLKSTAAGEQGTPLNQRFLSPQHTNRQASLRNQGCKHCPFSSERAPALPGTAEPANPERKSEPTTAVLPDAENSTTRPPL